MSDRSIVLEIGLGRYLIEARPTITETTFGGVRDYGLGAWRPVTRSRTHDEALKLAVEYADENRFHEVRVTDTQGDSDSE